MREFLVVDSTDAYALSVSKFKSEEKLLEAIQYKDIDDVEVYEIKSKVKLKKRVAMVFDDAL